MGIETRFIQGIEAERIAQAKHSVRSPRDEDKSYAYGLAVGTDRGLVRAVEIIRELLKSDDEEDEDEAN